MEIGLRGYLPAEDPVVYFEDISQLSRSHLVWWEDHTHNMSGLLRTKEWCRLIDAKMPILHVPENLKERENEAIMRNLSFEAAGFVWENGGHRLPAAIAIPLCEVAKKLGRPPILSYASYALNNWTRHYPEKPIEIENLRILVNFLHKEAKIDEEWFILIHIEIEARAAAGLTSIDDAQKSARSGDVLAMNKELQIMARALAAVNQTMGRMTENCDPGRYFQNVRPWITGYKRNPVTYEGVLDPDYQKPVTLLGETGAQSTLFPTFDAAFHIDHAQDDLKHFTDTCLIYSPKEHRENVLRVWKEPGLTDFVKECSFPGSDIIKSHDACIDEMVRFRETHLNYAENYIAKQTQTNPNNSNVYGTGGSNLIPYLQARLECTKRQRIDPK